ncbi:MAG: hypothetical protein EFKGCFLK_00025 [Rhodocyclaceae bacterium]|nr:MAG: hypothetical protein F9K21_12425 [Rhodocyclaceae bacterium]MBV6406480.1 hypothetical protein [Rhodocyclaceae bacterium]CAG0928688.1 Sensor histidine kinase YpdA [Rhodocyclaceae bacterium]
MKSDNSIHPIAEEGSVQLDGADVPVGVRSYAAAAAVMALGVTCMILILAYRPGGTTGWLVAPAALLSQCAAALACLRVRRWKPEPGWLVWLACGVLAGGAGAMAGIALGGGLLGREWVQILKGPALVRGALAGLLLGGCIATIWRLMADGLARERRWMAANTDLEIERLRLERGIARAELQVMQAQIEPHFLYNTLANLRQLIRTDAAGALHMTEQLIRYFKALTASLSQSQAPLENELVLCDSFMEIMRLRWGDRLEYVVACNEPAEKGMKSLSVPPGSLLTLVENAVKHGQPNDGSTPSIQVDIVAEKGRLSLTVTDNGAGPSAGFDESGRQGSGLANLRTRLALLYGTEAEVSLDTAKRGGCIANIRIPEHRRC